MEEAITVVESLEEVANVPVAYQEIDLSAVEGYLSTIEQLMIQNADALQCIYAVMLFVVGCLGAIGVCVLLYNFIRLFY